MCPDALETVEPGDAQFAGRREGIMVCGPPPGWGQLDFRQLQIRDTGRDLARCCCLKSSCHRRPHRSPQKAGRLGPWQRATAAADASRPAAATCPLQATALLLLHVSLPGGGEAAAAAAAAGMLLLLLLPFLSQAAVGLSRLASHHGLNVAVRLRGCHVDVVVKG